VAEAVTLWKRAEGRRTPGPTAASRERNFRVDAGPAPLPSYEAARDPHCTYALGAAFAASPYKAAREATRPGYRDDFLRAPRVVHLPKWPAASHAYRDVPVMPGTRALPTSEPGGDATSAALSAGAAARRDRAYDSSVADVDGERSRAYHLRDSLTHYNSGKCHPTGGSLGPEEGSLHWASVPARNWFKLQSEKVRSFHGDSWLEIVEANAVHRSTLDLRRENNPIPDILPKRRRCVPQGWQK
jgi:hypothetical protein